MAFFPPIETTITKGIEHIIHDGRPHRVYRPFRLWEYFLMPIVSIENELLLDRERREQLLANGMPPFPSPSQIADPNDQLDWHNDTSFMNEARFPELEAAYTAG